MSEPTNLPNSKELAEVLARVMRLMKNAGLKVPHHEHKICPNCGHVADHDACNGRIE